MDRIPDGVGLDAHDIAGMQISRLWAVPLVERVAFAESYSLVGLQAIERLDDTTWRLTTRSNTPVSPTTILHSWRESTFHRGSGAFFFLRHARVDSPCSLTVTTRFEYQDIRPFLDAFDLWIGLRAARDRWRQRSPGPSRTSVTVGRSTEIREVRDFDDARRLTPALAPPEAIRCALPGPFRVTDPVMTSSLTYVVIPAPCGLRHAPGDASRFVAEVRTREAALGGFEIDPRPIYFVPAGRSRVRVEFTDYFPNRDVAHALAAAWRTLLTGVQVDVLEAPYQESLRRQGLRGYQLTIVAPINGAPTGILRSVVHLAADWISPDVAVELLACLDHADIGGDDDATRRVAERVCATTGVGILGRYRCSSGAVNGRVSVSHQGIVRIDEWSGH
ncbi:hypothetical protein [Leifsonia sp. NPDC077715]|uniref:hypothetical protein n=1 Tax=Leifsonia sp. NPDC077715 TaxID=3155539 RepID=UPI003412BAF8